MTQSVKPFIIPASLETYIHRLVNAERRQHSLSELYWDAALSDIARNHSADMAVRGFFSHDTPEGRRPTDRAQAAGYPCRKRIDHKIYTGIAENIHMMDLFESARVWTNFIEHPGERKIVTGRHVTYSWYTQTEIAALTVNRWMNSHGHRRNMLTSHYQREGIGVVLHGNRAYITQNLF